MAEDKRKKRVYERVARKYPELMATLKSLGETARSSGPVDEKTSHLIQVAAAAAVQSEGSVHSHTKRALAAGASGEEIEHAILMLVSVIGFPRTAAALSWVYDILDEA